MSSSFFRKFTRQAEPSAGAATAGASERDEEMSLPAALPLRDTDEDWKIIGKKDPYFGVLTDPRFHKRNLTDQVRSDFFNSGDSEIDALFDRIRAIFGGFNPRSALDFGCGVGRLTRPLAQLCGDAVGVDVSEGMLAEARKHNRTSAVFMDHIPARTFDWVVSYIVLQHVTPDRGYALIGDLLKAVGPGGGISLHVTFARTAPHATDAGTRLVIGDGKVWPAGDTADIARVPAGIMIMHDYDLGRVIGLFYAHGFTSLHLDQTDHGGAIGAVIHARRA